MAHPFSVMFEKALKKSTTQDNLVLEVAEDLRKKGYDVHEIYEVLKKLHEELLGDDDVEIIGEVLAEFETYIEEDEDEE